jgi:hypothetical protein
MSTVGPFSKDHDKPTGSISRTFSKKLFAGGTTPKNSSPTQIPQSIPEGRAMNDSSSLDPSAAAMAASSHLTASMNGGQPSPKGIPSPTSPASFYAPQTLGSRSYSNNPSRQTYDHSDEGRHDRSGGGTSQQDHPSSTGSSSVRNTVDAGGPSVEIFKSFRVSMDDPCYKVLPAALKKYNINEDWRNYALYIVYGDQEGKKPMFMLRKQAQPLDGHSGSFTPGTAGIGIPSINTNSDGSTGIAQAVRTQTPQTSTMQVPGGVL